ENIIADDWLCNGGVVTDIHWWGNYEQEGAGIDYFHLSIHANDPACVPAEPPLWTANVPFTDVNETFEEYNIWGAEIYKYSYYLPEPFVQEEGSRYWLDICAYSNDPTEPSTTAIWRWQESSRTTSYMLCPASEKTATGGWQHIDWVTGDTLRYSGMAFEITSEPLDTEDYGDAPDSYKTLFASNGARHTVDYSIYLGNQVDTEPDGQPTLSALGDDNNNLDDEDGVIFTTVANPGDTLIFYVTPSVDGFLHAWFDFDVNGDFAGSTEHVLNSVNITGGTQNYFSCVLPATMPTGISYARFRFTTLDTALSYTGSAPDGEVEDYRLFVRDPIENSKMHFEQWPDLDTTGMDVRLSNMILADDWKCSETGYINDFHFWASFDGDNLPAEGPGQLSFIVSIYDNVPAGQGTDFSHPGDLLFEQTIMPVEYDVSQVTDNNPEDWYDPATGTYKHTNHLQAYQYDILFNQDESIFVQEKDSVYWIAVQEYEASGDYLVGWKSTDTLHHFMDDAVYWADDDWAPIYYPPEHLWAGHTLDLSFVMTGEAVDLDFGDAPDSYKTKLANDGARHACDFVTFLGDTIDVEVDGQPTVTALGDDNNNLDDEDGVVFTSGLYQGVTDSVIVTVSSAGHLNGWIDYNCDGDFADTGEHIIVDSVFSAAGKDTIAFTVPASATADTSYARFRFSNESGLNYYGLAYSGEVEDYQVVINETVETLDYGDAPDGPYPTLLASNGARHANDGLTYLGAQIDVEPDGWQSINALGDDNHNLDDEDGVTFTSALHPGEQGAITVQTSIAGAYLNAWIDFNNDGDWQDTNEHIIVDSILSAGLSPLTFNIPATASVTDSTYARFRFSTLTGLNTTGFAADGEVEDYRISITEAPDDDCKMHFHQWPDTTELGIDVNATYPLLLADDFLCTESGIINSIHLWGSWYNDDYTAPTFNLTLWTDNPGGPDLHSQPQTKVWEMFFSPDQYTDSLYHFADPGEYFYFPADGIIEPNADHQIWQYDFIIPDSLAYVQEEGMIYWLGVQVFETGEFNFGWKTSFNHWNDDAVYGLYDGGVWYELTYPEEHPYYPYSIDFSFYIDCTPTTPIVSISSIGDSICVSWNAIPCADTYTIYSSNDPYATFPSGWTVEATGVTTTSWCEDVSGSIKKFYRVTAVK
ncbi:MAG: hypothetical protein KGY75_06560, partial [Candidatus Cloacimonetes bacterium]|nr:hypothetical protein [Candidatus Cloacimonadota bacterium]